MLCFCEIMFLKPLSVERLIRPTRLVYKQLIVPYFLMLKCFLLYVDIILPRHAISYVFVSSSTYRSIN